MHEWARSVHRNFIYSYVCFLLHGHKLSLSILVWLISQCRPIPEPSFVTFVHKWMGLLSQYLPFTRLRTSGWNGWNYTCQVIQVQLLLFMSLCLLCYHCLMQSVTISIQDKSTLLSFGAIYFGIRLLTIVFPAIFPVVPYPPHHIIKSLFFSMLSLHWDQTFREEWGKFVRGETICPRGLYWHLHCGT